MRMKEQHVQRPCGRRPEIEFGKTHKGQCSSLGGGGGGYMSNLFVPHF